MRTKQVLLVFGAFVLSSSSAVTVSADVLDFDDAIPKMPGQVQSGRIPDGYGGFDWDNLWVWDSVRETTRFSQCLVSAPCFAFNGRGDPASLKTSSGDRFDFVGGHLAAMHASDLEVTFEGYRNGSLVHTKVVSVSRTASSWFEIDFRDIDELSLVCSASTNAHLGMDNAVLNIIPEPATLTMLAVGGLAMIRRRQHGERK